MKSGIKAILFPIIFAVLVTQVIACPARVKSGSMEPTLETGSMFLMYRVPYLAGATTPNRQDIICFKAEGSSELVVKRVIGIPGDTIEIKYGYVYLNGEQIEEPYLEEHMPTYQDRLDIYEVPEGSVFVLGDNRVNSIDSRSYENPYISIKNIKGLYVFTIF